MKSIKSEGLEPKKKKTSKIFKTSLALVLIVFAFTMSSPSFFQFVKTVEAAGTLSSIAILPSNNIVNTRTTYDIMFKTATTGTIKTLHMTFPNSFDVSAATRVIERSGIGSGSLSAPSCSISSCELKYTVSSPVSVPAGTTIRLEIGRIVNSDTAGSFKVGISTEAQVILDGPTQSPSFPIKDITGNDVSPNFMVQKILKDDTVGNNHGWNPDGTGTAFGILDSDINAPLNAIHVDLNTQSSLANVGGCTVASLENGAFSFSCSSPPPNGAELHYLITKLPANVVTSSLSLSSSDSTPSSESSSQYESLRGHDQIASEFP
jgi:hypothetical protein